jgi:4-hydroxybenzoate polyprenyltransferase
MQDKIIRFIFSHSIFISLCAAGLSFQTIQILHDPINYFLLGFIFFACLCGYNSYWVFSKFLFGKPANKISFILHNRDAAIIIFLSLSGMLFCALHIHPIWYNILLTFLFLLFYGASLMPFAFFQYIRKIGFIKTVLLSLTWAHVTIMIPLQKTVFELSPIEILLYINRFLFMMMLCILFDKRDMITDKIRGLGSLATIVSEKNLNRMILVVFLLLLFSCFLLFQYQLEMNYFLALIISAFGALWAYAMSLKKRGYYFYYFFVDGMMLFSAVVSFLLSI